MKTSWTCAQNPAEDSGKIIQNLNMQMSWTDPGGVEDPERGIRALVVRLVIEELDRKSSGGDVSHNQRRQVQRERERE